MSYMLFRHACIVFTRYLRIRYEKTQLVEDGGSRRTRYWIGGLLCLTNTLP